MPQENALSAVLERLKVSPSDEDAWASLFRQLWPFVIAVIYRRLRGEQRSAAEDAGQEVFLRLFRSRPFARIENVDALRAYMWKMAENVALQQLKRKHAEDLGERDLAEWQELEPRPGAVDGETALFARDVSDLVGRVLEEKDRELLRLMIEGSSLGQAADKMGLSYTNAGVRLHRIRRKLVHGLGLRDKEMMPRV
jgi:RNA polymerase sigma factor (sigma-70 family)